MSADRSLLMLCNSNLSKGAGLVHYITQPSIMRACGRNLWVLFCSTIGLWLESKLKFWTCWGEGRIVIHWRKTITRKTRKKGTLTMSAYQSLLMHISNLSKGAGLGHYITQPSIMRACGRNLSVCPFLSRFADVAPANSLHSLLPLLSCYSLQNQVKRLSSLHNSPL